MSFAGAIRSALRQYVTFRGRAGRPEFWWWYLCTVLVNIVTTTVDKLTDATIGINFVSTVVSLCLLVPTLAVSVRRLHDSNVSGWWLLAPIGTAIVGLGLIVAGIGALIVPAFLENAPDGSRLALVLFAAAGLVLLASVVLDLILMLRRSTPGTNRFGPQPGTPSQDPPTGSLGHPSHYASSSLNPARDATDMSGPGWPSARDRHSSHRPW